MKKIFLSLLLLASCSSEPTATDPASVKVHVSIVTHSEEPRSGTEPDYSNDEAAFWEKREQVVNFAEMLHEEGVKYNYQSDWSFLLAATMFDKGDESTNGKNFLRYLKEDLGFEIDPHAHETKYSYADVAYLINELGVEPSHTVGGHLALPTEDSKLEYLWSEVKGKVYDYSWQAEILWGGGTANHVDEDELWISGVWKPQDNENHGSHDENAPLPNVGKYKEGWDALTYLLEQDLQAGKIYTITIQAHQRDMDEAFIEEFRTQIQNFKSDDRIVWAGLSEVIEIWKSEYNSEPNLLKYDGPTDEDEQGSGKLGQKNCGDGICTGIEKKICPEDCE
jgi:hypothetical protein